jgi:hypothetical protein
MVKPPTSEDDALSRSQDSHLDFLTLLNESIATSVSFPACTLVVSPGWSMQVLGGGVVSTLFITSLPPQYPLPACALVAGSGWSMQVLGGGEVSTPFKTSLPPQYPFLHVPLWQLLIGQCRSWEVVMSAPFSGLKFCES